MAKNVTYIQMPNIRGHEEDEFLKMLDIKVSELEVHCKKKYLHFFLCWKILSAEEVLVWHTKTASVRKFAAPNNVYRDTNIYSAWQSV